MNEKVSIIMPFYQAEDYVERMLNAVKCQTYTNWELIAVSNGPYQEKQNEIVEKYAKTDSRIRLISTDVSGVSNARNIGVAKATGKWITFLDADDLIELEHLQNYMDVVDEQSELVVMGFQKKETHSSINRVILENVDSKECGFNEVAKKYLSYTYLELVYFSIWNKLFLTDSIRKNDIKFDIELSFMEDAVFCLQYFSVAKRIQLLDKTSYIYVVNSNSSTYKYHSCLERVFGLVRSMQKDLHKRIDMPDSFQFEYVLEKKYLDTYLLILNQYRRGAEKITFKTKLSNIRRWINDPEFIQAKTWYMRKPRNMVVKFFNMCISTRSPFFTYMLMASMFRLKRIGK